MKNQFFLIKSLLIILLIFSFLPETILADGMTINYDPNFEKWDYSNENNQRAFINYNANLQKMIISVNLDKGNNNDLIWLFPIPAEPNKIAIDVLKDITSLNTLNGYEISGKAKQKFYISSRFIYATQLYTIPYLRSRHYEGDNGLIMPWGISNSLIESPYFEKNDVTVYEHLDKEGITSEIITAKTVDGLYNYFKNKGLDIAIDSIPVLNNYIGKNYSFVVSWISQSKKIISAEEIKNNLNFYFLNQNSNPKFSDLINSLKQKYPKFKLAHNSLDYLKSKQGEVVLQKLIQAIQTDPSIIANLSNNQTGQKQVGLFVTFFTNKIYFPLLPTSVYGSKVIPITIRVIGHVSPKVFQDIKGYTNIEYYIDTGIHFTDGLENFYNGQTQNVKYTKIEINAPSKFLTDDLWINAKTPLKTYYFLFIARHPFLTSMVLLVAISIITSILVGLIIFKDLRNKNSILKLALVGLSNCLSIIGLMIATILFRTKSKNENVAPLLKELSQKGYIWKRKLAAISLCIDWPFAIIGAIIIIVFILYPYNFRYGGTLVFIRSLIPFIILVFVLFIKRIRPEDKFLFNQLKSIGYSSWSFQPTDKMKFIFVPLFSVSFLTITWYLIRLIQLTV